MNQNNVWQEYLKAVPELQAPFEAQCRENWVDGTDGPYVIWGMGLMPCILERLAYEEQNKDLLDRTFAFLKNGLCQRRSTGAAVVCGTGKTWGR